MRETQNDEPLSSLNEAGQAHIERKPPRNWDGETISLEAFLIIDGDRGT
jgi:hypothetical protein